MTIELQPFSLLADQPAVTTSGSFLAGTTATFFFTFPDLEGNLFDPSDINIIILDINGETVHTATAADKLEIGQYAFEWCIPATQTPGLYTLRVEFVVEQIQQDELEFIGDDQGSTTSYFTEDFVVGESDIAYIDPQIIAFRAFVEYLIGYTQRIPVFHEIGRLDRNKTKALFSFPRWNQPSGATVYINGHIRHEGYSIDFLKGNITFSNILSDYDEVRASYNFRWFTDDELDAFTSQAVEVFNQFPPSTIYGLVTLPARFGVTVAHQAAIFALRRLLCDILYQEPSKIFGGMDRADRVFGSLESLKRNYEEDVRLWYEQKKRGPYIGLTRTITAPEFTLPGSRSRWFRYLFK